MPIKIQKWIVRKDLQNNPEDLYVFGDNMERVGYGGQAAEMRDEPNAVGIPTKMSPAQCFKDEDYNNEVVYKTIVLEFNKLFAHVKNGGTIVWPKDCIGTGLASLQDSSPRMWDFIQQEKNRLFEKAGYFGHKPCQWHSNEETEQFDVQVVQVVCKCPRDGCQGLLEASGEGMWPTNPPGIWHRCTNCQSTYAIRGGRSYPRMEYKRVDLAGEL